MTALQFIASLVESAAWPVAAVALGLLFRRPIIRLLPRIVRLRFSGIEAELAAVEQTAELQNTLTDASKLLLPAHVESEQARRKLIEALMRQSATWGFTMGQVGTKSLPTPEVSWDDNEPKIKIDYKRVGRLVDDITDEIEPGNEEALLVERARRLLTRLRAGRRSIDRE